MIRSRKPDRKPKQASNATTGNEPVAAEQLRSFVDRILRLKEEQDTIGDDVKDIYAEAKGLGFDKTAMGQLVQYLRKRGKDAMKFDEQSAIFDLYLKSYEGPAAAVVDASHTLAYARTRENITEFPVKKRSDGGADIKTKHENITTRPAPEPAPAAVERRTSEGSSQGEAEDAGVTVGETALNPELPPHDAITGELLEASESAASPAEETSAAAEPAGASVPAPSSDPSLLLPQVGEGQPAAEPAPSSAAGDSNHPDPLPFEDADGHPRTPSSAREAQKAEGAFPPVDQGGADAPGIYDEQAGHAVTHSSEDAPFRIPQFLTRSAAPAELGEPKLNEKCQRPTECKWAYSSASCSPCNQIWFRQRAAQ
jgi:uncharacterized protein (UPF0335 family)